jgi:hypothetical protein
MKKLLTLLAFLMLSGANFAQETAAPDYAGIYKNITDKDSDYYYPALVARYTAADTSMTLQQRRHLYYGYATMANKAGRAESAEALRKMSALLMKPEPGREDLEAVLDYTTTILASDPYSITIKQYRQYCLRELGYYKQAIAERAQTEIIIDAILSSGDGSTANNTIHVVSQENEFEIIQLLGFEAEGDEYATNGQVDYIILGKNAYGKPGLYFEVPQQSKQLTGL